jgi:hypothetical protein
MSHFAPARRGESHIQVICTLHLLHWIYKILEENFSKDNLKLWSKSSQFCSLKLKDHNVIIRVKPMIYSKNDIDEFDIQIKELFFFWTCPHKRGKGRFELLTSAS